MKGHHVMCMVLSTGLLLYASSLARAYPGTMRYTAFACATKEAYTRTDRMARQNDWEAVFRMMATKQCTRLERGETVEVEDVTWGGLVQVRQRGRTERWWLDIQLVERKK